MTMADQASSPDIPGYTIIRKIGSGGSAEVYLAVQQSLNRRVALKLVKSTLTSDATFAERFKREGRIIAQLNHPHIIPVYDIGEHGEQYYMAMEYMGAGDLRAQAEQLTLNDLLEILLQITQALQVAHQRGFVHRDIKPANILFRSAKQAVLSDFGIARQTESLTQMTVTGAMLGTPAYMSPEQINGLALDGRADLYSLGVTLFEMVTGYLPYRGESMMAVAMQHMHAEVPRLPATSSFLQPLIDRLLAKAVDERISDAQALHTEIQKLLGVKEKFSVPITSLWPDKVPESQSTTDFSWGTASAAKKPAKGWRLAAATALGLIVSAGAFIGLQTDSPPAGESSTLASEQSEPTVPLQPAPAITPVPAPAEPVAQADPWQRTLAQASQLLEQGQLIAPPDNNALALYRQVLQQDAANIIASNAEQNILQRQVLQVEQLILAQSLEQAEKQLATLDSLWQDAQQLQGLRDRIAQQRERMQADKLAAAAADRQRKVDDHLQAATAAMLEGRYLRPNNSSAVKYLNQALVLQPQNPAAKRGLQKIADALGTQLESAIADNDFASAESLLKDLRAVDAQHAKLTTSVNDIAAAKAAFEQQQLEQQRQAELQTAIDQLLQRNNQWQLSSADLDIQARTGDSLISDITRLLNDHPDNSQLQVLRDTTRHRLEQIAAQQLPQTPPAADKKPIRKPMIGGF